MAGWVPMDADWWPVIAESLPKPWPREAILQDLRWWAARRGRPGRVVLARRWGVTQWGVRRVLRGAR